MAPRWLPQVVAELITPADLATRLLDNPAVTGLTFSGGEPMMQAAGLAETARRARAKRPVTVVCFTGFTLEELRASPPGPGVADFLSEIDVLVDGLYVANQNDGLGLRGSSNQRTWHLTDRLLPFSEELAHGARRAEIHVADDHLFMVGVPPTGVLEQVRGISRGTGRKGQTTA